MKNIEIEIQVQVEHVAPLKELLDKSGTFKSMNHQRDEYFTPSHRDFLSVRPAKEWLRVRDSDGVYSINYKYWHLNEEGKSTYCDEYETPISDIEQMRNIFSALDFTARITVDKTRSAWIYNDWEISLDSVEGLGDFVEIEYKGANEVVDPTQETNKMVAFLKHTGCGTISRNYVGYPFQLLYPDEVKLDTL
ncbi:MAG: class IV adenylate cyclase [Patescibacteria group bacterium]